jgi:CelD/BcsL family acetyltransferase involved in cellulose biosynthesis
LHLQKEPFSNLAGYYAGKGEPLKWSSPFILPAWLESWWAVFGAGYEELLYSAWSGGELIGLAPMMRQGEEASLIGSPDVCDYLDFVIKPGTEEPFMAALLAQLQEEGIRKINLPGQRPDATAFKGFFNSADNFGWRGEFIREAQSFELSVPATWEEYLSGLPKKQRHEVRRKLRRLEKEAPTYDYSILAGEEEVVAFLPLFYELFLQNPEKASFLSQEMKRYFHTLVSSTARIGIARFAVLKIDHEPAAAVLYFDYANRIWLYNSGYKTEYRTLSIGLISKILLIKDSITRGRQVFDFLKGREVYKSRLGGTPIPIYHLTLTIQ